MELLQPGPGHVRPQIIKVTDLGVTTLPTSLVRVMTVVCILSDRFGLYSDTN